MLTDWDWSMRREPCALGWPPDPLASANHWFVVVCLFALLDAVIEGHAGGLVSTQSSDDSAVNELVESTDTLQTESGFGALKKSLNMALESTRPSHQIDVSSYSVFVSR